MKLRYFIVSVILCLTLAGAAAAEAAYQPDQEPNLPSVSRIVVKKSERRMELLDRRGNVIRDYRIALGKNPVGRKIKEGDNKTPEGEYVIDMRKDDSDYHLALRISYPGPNDVVRAKKAGANPGGNIFIHGMPNDGGWMWWKYNDRRDWTFGCIAVNNDAIEEIWQMVPKGTPIVIKP